MEITTLEKNPDTGLWRYVARDEGGETLYESRDFDSKGEARKTAYQRGWILANVTSAQRDK